MLIDVSIAGKTPLICNKFGDESALAATRGLHAVAPAGSKGSPREQAERKLYYGADGKTLIIPQPNMLRSIVDGGSFFKSGRSKITTQKSSILYSCTDIQGSEIPIQHKDPWCVDVRAVRIPATGGRILAYRPIFNDWRLSFTIDLDSSIITPELFREIVDAAGTRIGLGDFRPSCKGPFGRFNVVEWRVN